MERDLKDNIPSYIYKHNNYENTCLQEHASLLSGAKDTAITEAQLEMQARLYVGMCLKEDSYQFIEDRLQKYIKDEYEKATGDTADRRNMAISRAWSRIINEAAKRFKERYHVDGSRAKLAVLDYCPWDGFYFAELPEINYETADDKV